MNRRKLEDKAARAFVSRVVDRAVEANDIDGLKMLLSDDVNLLALAVKGLAAKVDGPQLAVLVEDAAKLNDGTVKDRKLEAELALVNLGLKPLDAEHIVENIRRNAVAS